VTTSALARNSLSAEKNKKTKEKEKEKEKEKHLAGMRTALVLRQAAAAVAQHRTPLIHFIGKRTAPSKSCCI
jgi:hypothetical protein